MPVEPPAAATISPAAAIPDRIRAFLREPNVVTIGTTGADGEPHQAVAWFRLEPDDRILLNSRYPRRWPADLRRDPRISLAIQAAADPMGWVGLSGVVETIVDDVAIARADICDLAMRYDDDAPARLAEFRTQPRISFRIRITSIHDHLGDD
jgi:PPOX class probable F420-dependent enzyme